MAGSKKLANPFYVLLVIAGTLFCLTAFAYGVMTVRALHPDAQDASASGAALMDWLDEKGFRLMIIELGILAVATVAAIATDSFWQQQERRVHERSESKQ